MTPKLRTDELARIELSRRHLTDFTVNTFGKFSLTQFHDVYFSILNLFAYGKIKKLIISMQPQVGKSEGSTRRLPAFILGRYPDKKIAIASYSHAKARKFGREIKRIMNTRKYELIFPQTRLATARDKNAVNTADIFEIPKHEGSLLLAGRSTALTGEPVDVLIMDDMYKDKMEANSPLIRDNVIEWYESVADTRLHNDSQQLIVFTRWHEEDLVGHLETKSTVVELKRLDQLENLDPAIWYKINFPAIQVADPTDFDRRKFGQVLWPERQSKERLVEKQERDEETFECLYQGDPQPKTGLLYTLGFRTYRHLPEDIYDRLAYIDTADTGDDYLLCICGIVGGDDKLYVTHVYYTQEPAEVTEPETARILMASETYQAVFESNAGGRAFARNVRSLIDAEEGETEVKWFYQSANKEARVLTNANSLQRIMVFPFDWASRWPLFYKHMTTFRKKFKANKHDDAPDGATGLLELSGLADDDQIYGGTE